MKTVLITGASSGIGKETAILFSKKGWNVAATVRSIEKQNVLASYKNITTYLLDVKDSKSISQCIKQVVKNYGKIDVLVNNAGVYTTNPLEETTDEAINDVIDTNIKGVINTTKAILEHFRENNSGTIVNISSVAGRVTFPFQSIYHSSKWAIEGLSESLYYELKLLGIKIKVVEPGMVKTNLYHSVSEFPYEQYPKEYQTPFKKWHRFLLKSYTNGYLPQLDAKTIFKAANSNNSRLRYTTDFTTKLVLFLRSLFPLPIFQKIVKSQAGI